MAVYQITSIKNNRIPGIRLQKWYRFAGDTLEDAARQMFLLYQDKFAEVFKEPGDEDEEDYVPHLILHSDGVINGMHWSHVYLPEDEIGVDAPLLAFQTITYDRDTYNIGVTNRWGLKQDLSYSAAQHAGELEFQKQQFEFRKNNPGKTLRKPSRDKLIEMGAEALEKRKAPKPSQREKRVMKTHEIYDVESPFDLKLGGTNRRVFAVTYREAAKKFAALMQKQIIRDKVPSNDGRGGMMSDEPITLTRTKSKVPTFTASAGVFGEFLSFKVRVDYGV